MFQGPAIASVIAFLNANGITDAAGGPTDIALTSSFNNFVLNPVDIPTGPQTVAQTEQPLPAPGAFKVRRTFVALP